VTETTTANLVVEMKGSLITPPVQSGLLAGTYRAELLADGTIQEALVRVEDLFGARRLWLINSVQKWREAEVIR